MLLLVGLGNPGAEHAKNRHNIGFMAVDAIHRHHRFSAWRRKFVGEVAEGVIEGERCLALKPLTYMNESGRSVGEAARFHKIPLESIVAFHDELDLAAGKVRVKRGGGNAGHNGLRSLSAHLGPDFWRVRLGIGHPGDKHRVHGHVLSDFARSDAAWVADLCEACAEFAGRLVTGEEANFQNRVHLWMEAHGHVESKRASVAP